MFSMQTQVINANVIFKYKCRYKITLSVCINIYNTYSMYVKFSSRKLKQF